MDEVTFGAAGSGCLVGAAGGVRPVGSVSRLRHSRRGEYDSSASGTGRASGSDHAGQWAICRSGDGASGGAAAGERGVLHAGGSDPTVDGQAYIAPLEVAETTVLRAVALHEGAPVSAVTTATYLVDENTGLPVLSLVTDPAHLWDEETGIYANPGGARPGMGAAGDGGVAVAGRRVGLQCGGRVAYPRWF